MTVGRDGSFRVAGIQTGVEVEDPGWGFTTFRFSMARDQVLHRDLCLCDTCAGDAPAPTPTPTSSADPTASP